MGMEIRKGNNTLDILPNGAAKIRGVTRNLLDDLKMRGFGFYGHAGAQVQGEPRATALISSSGKMGGVRFMHVLGGELGNKYGVNVAVNAGGNTPAACNMTVGLHAIALQATMKDDYFAHGRHSKGNACALQIVGANMGPTGSNLFSAYVNTDGSILMLAAFNTNGGSIAHADAASAIASNFSDYLESVTSTGGSIASASDTGLVSFTGGVDICTYTVADASERRVVTIGFANHETTYNDIVQMCLAIWKNAIENGSEYNISLADVVVPIQKPAALHPGYPFMSSDAVSSVANFSGGVGMSLGYRPVLALASASDINGAQAFVEGVSLALGSSAETIFDGLDIIVLSGLGISTEGGNQYSPQRRSVQSNIQMGDDKMNMKMIGSKMGFMNIVNTYGAGMYGYSGGSYNNVAELPLENRDGLLKDDIADGESLSDALDDNAAVLYSGSIHPGETLDVIFTEHIIMGNVIGLAAPHGIVVMANEQRAFFNAHVKTVSADGQPDSLLLDGNAPVQMGGISGDFYGVIYPGYTIEGAKNMMDALLAHDPDQM